MWCGKTVSNLWHCYSVQIWRTVDEFQATERQTWNDHHKSQKPIPHRSSHGLPRSTFCCCPDLGTVIGKSATGWTSQISYMRKTYIDFYLQWSYAKPYKSDVRTCLICHRTEYQCHLHSETSLLSLWCWTKTSWFRERLDLYLSPFLEKFHRCYHWRCWHVTQSTSS